ncbi:MAG: caspase family protein [Acidimicrobiia bacterium]|jgi:hypothetical protein|nr:caspase family protein [Acidimicrobiia bacterium]
MERGQARSARQVRLARRLLGVTLVVAAAGIVALPGRQHPIGTPAIEQPTVVVDPAPPAPGPPPLPAPTTAPTPAPVAPTVVVEPEEQPLPPAPVGTALGPVPADVLPITPPAAVAPSGPAPFAASTAGRTLAVVIGVDDYPGTDSDLSASVADGRDAAQALYSLGAAPADVLTLYDGQADGETVVRALRWLAAEAGPTDTAVLFVAGHVRELGGPTEAFLAADGALVTDEIIAGELAPMRAARTWLVFATCYGGGFDEALAPGRVLTAAAGPAALAYESADYNRSFLGEFVFRRGLLGGQAGSTTVEGVVAWAQARLVAEHPARGLWTAGDGTLIDLRPASAG